jgi:hypothetical protein
MLVVVYAYHTGSCKINKKYICNKDFCLYIEFHIALNKPIRGEINHLLDNKYIQKRVNITTYPENILNCAMPNKSGITISTQSIIKHGFGSNSLREGVIDFYQNELCHKISKLLNLKLFPTSLDYPTSCAILIYENENDWINWHYDYNYYDGRFFTILIPITNDLTCTKFQFKNDKNEIISMDLNNNAICFEGNYLYHRASKLCKNQKRVMLSCQYVTDNSMSFVNQLRIKLKDFAYIGRLF